MIVFYLRYCELVGAEYVGLENFNAVRCVRKKERLPIEFVGYTVKEVEGP